MAYELRKNCALGAFLKYVYTTILRTGCTNMWIYRSHGGELHVIFAKNIILKMNVTLRNLRNIWPMKYKRFTVWDGANFLINGHKAFRVNFCLLMFECLHVWTIAGLMCLDKGPPGSGMVSKWWKYLYFAITLHVCRFRVWDCPCKIRRYENLKC